MGASMIAATSDVSSSVSRIGSSGVFLFITLRRAFKLDKVLSLYRGSSLRLDSSGTKTGFLVGFGAAREGCGGGAVGMT